jgi:hypothetical protein
MVSKNKSRSNLKFQTLLAAFIMSTLTSVASAQEIQTNAILMPSAPSWLTDSRVDKVVDKVQSKLEWDIRKITVQWYSDPAQFQKLHGFGDSVLAFSQRNTMTIAMGPKIDTSNFDGVFGHELTHIILYQKYKDAIPSWLDEGLANFIGQNSKVDYKWLATQPHPDVHTMTHPFKASVVSPRYQYQASTAVIEMLDAKCGLDDLLQLSVGKNLENYLATFCGITDINQSFIAWVNQKATATAGH